MKKLILPVLLVAGVYAFIDQTQTGSLPDVSVERSDTSIAQAFERRSHGQQVAGGGTVTRILADDNDGSRHQRFILQLATGQTLLIAHNIDLAPRVAGLREGDRVSFYGEYASPAGMGMLSKKKAALPRPHAGAAMTYSLS